MNTKENFKDFVKQNPILLKYVKEGKGTWQQFFEIYDLYGDDETAWKDYIITKKTKVKENIEPSSTFDLVSFLKGLDLDSIQEGVNSLQRVLGLLQDMSSSKDVTAEIKRPRPLYKHFDD